MRRGMVRDAATARLAASINVLLWSVDAVLKDHIRKAEAGEYGGRCGQELAWDLIAARARLQTAADYMNGVTPEKLTDRKFQEKLS